MCCVVPILLQETGKCPLWYLFGNAFAPRRRATLPIPSTAMRPFSGRGRLRTVVIRPLAIATTLLALAGTTAVAQAGKKPAPHRATRRSAADTGATHRSPRRSGPDTTALIASCGAGKSASCRVMSGIAFSGKPLPADTARGTEFLERACRAGDARACGQSAWMVRQGIGQRADTARALRL